MGSTPIRAYIQRDVRYEFLVVREVHIRVIRAGRDNLSSSHINKQLSTSWGWQL